MRENKIVCSIPDLPSEFLLYKRLEIDFIVDNHDLYFINQIFIHTVIF